MGRPRRCRFFVLVSDATRARRYEHVLRYEEWPALARALQRLVAPSQPLLESLTTDALARANALYTPALATMANAWARTDSALFGYAPWVPGQAIRMAPVRHA